MAFEQTLDAANTKFQAGVDLMAAKAKDGNLQKGDADPALALWLDALDLLESDIPDASDAVNRCLYETAEAEIHANLAVWQLLLKDSKDYARAALADIQAATSHPTVQVAGPTASDLAFWKGRMQQIVDTVGADTDPSPTWSSGGQAFLDKPVTNGSGLLWLALLAGAAYLYSRKG